MRKITRQHALIWFSLASLFFVAEGNARGGLRVQTEEEEWLDFDNEEEAHTAGSLGETSPLSKKSQHSGPRMDMLRRKAQSIYEDEGQFVPNGMKESPEKEERQISVTIIGFEYPTSPSPTPKPQVEPTESPTESRSSSSSKQQQDDNTQTCNPGGFSRFPFRGKDSPERLLLREGVVDELPMSRCGNAGRKNVILVVGDGMGWEMARAGAIARQVIDELEGLGCNTTSGCPNNTAAIAAFEGRNLTDYYTEGKGSGLSFQNLTDFALVTTSATVVQKPNGGNNSAPPYGMLDGVLDRHENGMAPLALNDCGFPIDFDPTDHITEGGNMVLWDDVRGGQYPWDPRYSQDNPDTSDGFDPLYIVQHATDSAATATTLATGQKVANTMMAVNLYEEEISTIVEDAMKCGMAGGVVSSKPILHATPGAFISHSNNRQHRDQLRRSFREVNPTLASGTCDRRFYPFEEDLESMRNGPLNRTWTLFEQKPTVLAENFYRGLETLDPDNDDHVLVCLGGDFTPSGKEDLPYRGVDSSYSNRWCGKGTVERAGPNATNPDLPIGVTPNTRLCDHYTQEEIKQIPHITQNVKAALDFLSKDDDGFFLMYEQGDIDTAAHSNHMDDMLGTLLDIDDSVRYIMNWITANGGWEKNALYVTADHDHYLTLLPHFPEALAKFLIAGEGHNITPETNGDTNPWVLAIQADRHEQLADKTITEHLRDFSTWTDQDVANVGHFWGPTGSGGNGWGHHSTRPVPLYYQGDDDCIEQLLGKGYQVLGREVQGVPGKIDQVHIHACMMKNLFGL